MAIKPAIRTKKEIEKLTAGISGTWVRRRNARKKMIAWSNELVEAEINEKKKEVRSTRHHYMSQNPIWRLGGTIKCGELLCDACECHCDKVITY